MSARWRVKRGGVGWWAFPITAGNIPSGIYPMWFDDWGMAFRWADHHARMRP